MMCKGSSESTLEGKKVLVTGSTGFIGANLVHQCLREGADVAILTRETSNKWRISSVLKDVEEYCVDLLDEAKLEDVILHIRPEIIFHTAVHGGYPSLNHSSIILKTNVIGTANLINACRKVEFELFVNSGSSSEYGIKPTAMKEADSLNPIGAYGVSKASATMYCQAISLAEDRPIVTLRLFSPYGYYEERTRLIPSVIVSCLQGQNPRVSSPDSIRDFIFVEDVMELYIKAAENRERIAGQIFNAGCGIQQTIGKVVTDIIKLTEANVEPEWNAVSNPRIEPKVWRADISKTQKLLNWQPKYHLEEGLEKTITWFRENMQLYAN